MHFINIFINVISLGRLNISFNCACLTVPQLIIQAAKHPWLLALRNPRSDSGNRFWLGSVTLFFKTTWCDGHYSCFDLRLYFSPQYRSPFLKASRNLMYSVLRQSSLSGKWEHAFIKSYLINDNLVQLRSYQQKTVPQTTLFMQTWVQFLFAHPS